MKLISIKRILKDDFPPEVQQWIGTLLFPLNTNIEHTSEILQKNVTLTDNIAAEVKTIQVVGSSMITGNSTAGSNLITNASYYQAIIDGATYGVSANQSINGLGLPPGTVITSVNGNTLTLSQNSSISQTGAKYLSGGFFPLNIQHTLSFRPTAVFISNVTDLQGNPTYIAEGVTPQWRLDSQNVIIDGISGLQAGRTYNITFVIL